MKECPCCNKEKNISEFPKSSYRKSGIHPYCKSCCVQKSRKWRKENPETYDIAKKKRVLKLRQKIKEYLSTHPCIDCGCSDIRVLQFDHLRDKKEHISVMVCRAQSWTVIEEEIAKCEVRCANCHIIKTAIQLNWYSYQ